MGSCWLRPVHSRLRRLSCMSLLISFVKVAVETNQSIFRAGMRQRKKPVHWLCLKISYLSHDQVWQWFVEKRIIFTDDLYGVEGGGGGKFVPQLYKCLSNFATLRSYILALFKRRITFKLGKFTNVKTLFSAVSKDFHQIMPIKTWKNVGRVFFL